MLNYASFIIFFKKIDLSFFYGLFFVISGLAQFYVTCRQTFPHS